MIIGACATKVELLRNGNAKPSVDRETENGCKSYRSFGSILTVVATTHRRCITMSVCGTQPFSTAAAVIDSTQIRR